MEELRQSLMPNGECLRSSMELVNEPRSEKTGQGFPTWSDTNRAVQSEKIARGLKFRI